MNTLALAGVQALQPLWSADPKLMEIVALSLEVSLSAVALATLLGLPLGEFGLLFERTESGLSQAGRNCRGVVLRDFPGADPVPLQGVLEGRALIRGWSIEGQARTRTTEPVTPAYRGGYCPPYCLRTLNHRQFQKFPQAPGILARGDRGSSVKE